MIKSIWIWILSNVFHIKTETKQTEIEENQKYANEYERIDEINFSAMFSNKLANYVVSDSNMNILGDNDRTELLNKLGQSMWKKMKKYTSMSFGYGGVFIVPYVKKGKLYYSVVPQGRVTIDETEGDLITGATILAEKKEIQTNMGQTKTYLRWTNYRLKDSNLIIEQKFSDEMGHTIPTPDFWKNIMVKQTITNVDRVLFGYIKSPVNNRKANDKYGVPITYGCDDTIREIKETMKQMLYEYRAKKTFVGVDATLFNGKDALPTDSIYKSFDFGTGGESKFEIFDPAFRPYTDRLQELYKRLEHEIGTSYGILSEVDSVNATATEIKRSMYDTFTLCDDMRTNIEKAMEDLFYSCNVLANAYNLSSQGDYKIDFDWSYSLLEDTDAEFSHLMQGESKGVVKKEELRQWIYPDEDIETSKKAVEEIKKENPDVQSLLGVKKDE
jgi:A118 family predicted phage portal protein